ncbi:synaptophysin-like protein 1, partial [Cyanocitta cristata]
DPRCAPRPRRLNQATFQPSLTQLCNHTWPRDVHLVGDFSSAARFFVAVAVAAFLYSLGALGGYLGYLHLYRAPGSRLPLMVSGGGLPAQVCPGVPRCAQVGFECPGVPRWGLSAQVRLYLGYLHLYRAPGSRLPLMPQDLVASGLVAALWLVASSAWAQALGHVRAAVAAPLPHCPSPTVNCVRTGVTPMGSLGASVAFGFLNLLLWAGGCWFVYKETPLHRPAPPPDPAPSPM